MHSMMRTLFAAAGIALLSGCAAPTIDTNPGHNHPANPNSAEAPPPARSSTLALNPAELPPPTAEDAGLGMEHGATQHGEMPDGGMHHGMTGMSHDGMSHDMPSTRPG